MHPDFPECIGGVVPRCRSLAFDILKFLSRKLAEIIHITWKFSLF